MSDLDLSVIIACYNEHDTLATSVDELVVVLAQSPLRYELVYVDDASRDDTTAIIGDCVSRYPSIPAHVIKHPVNTGRGRAVTDGFRAAHGRIVGYLDIDLEVHARYIPSMVDAIDRLGYDVATGRRFYEISRSGIVRAASSLIYHGLVRATLGLPYRDTETGFKFFRRDALARVIDRPSHPGWFWDTEIMAYCLLEELRVTEIPCVFQRRSDKVSSVRLVPDTIDYLRSLVKFRPIYRAACASRVAAQSPVHQGSRAE